LLRNIIRYLMIFVFAFAPPLQLAAQNSVFLAPQSQRDISDKLSMAYLQLSEKIPSYLYDLDGLTEFLDYEFDAAIAFVKQNVAFDPYIGVLRGADGTLRAEAGSAWDQAVLLAKLLRAMGGEAVIARGNLSTADARRLLNQLFEERSAFVEPFDRDQMLSAFSDTLSESQRAELQKALAVNTNKPSLEILEIVDTVSGKLIDAMQDAGKPVQELVPLKPLIDELATSYVWVRFRNSQFEEWQDIHPAFGNQPHPDIEIINTFEEVVPTEWAHNLEIELEIERTFDGTIEHIPIMLPLRGAAAEFASRQTRLEIVPNRTPSTTNDNPDFFSPVIDGELASGAKAFTFRGETAPADLAFLGPTLFVTVSDKFGDAVSALANPDNPRANGPDLTGLILTVTHQAPNGIQKTEVRRITELRGEQPEDAWRDIVQTIIFSTTTGRTNGSKAARDILQGLAATTRALPYFAAIIDGRLSLEDAVSHPAFDQISNDASWPQIKFFENEFEYPGKGAAKIVRSGPLVITKRISARTNGNGLVRTVVDIAHHGAIAIKKNGSEFYSSPTVLLKQGVWETIVENFTIGIPFTLGWLKADIEPIASTDTEITSVTKQLPQHQTERIQSDFKNSGAVALVEGFDRWWRINPHTGQTLGMTASGGATANEYAQILSLVSLTITVIAFVYGTYSCEKSHNTLSAQTCCLVGNGIMMAAGVGIGSAVGSGVSSRYYTWYRGAMIGPQLWPTALGALASTTFGVYWDASTTLLGELKDLEGNGLEKAYNICGEQLDRMHD